MTSEGSQAAGRGVVRHWTRTLIPTTREAPADARTTAHILLSRAGYIRPVGAGIYDYLPLAWRTLWKISAIVRDEMDAAGASELLLPALEPIEFFAETKRDVDYGENLFRLKDRTGKVLALAPTHEEIITALLRGAITSYRQLPLNLYQIQTKFRDEARPRAGLLRCREFLMKDAYSFHVDVEGPGGLNETYDAMYRAYSRIFTRCGLPFIIVEAESGPIGGSASHEFMVPCESGEDTILRCPVSGYAANVEKCEIGTRPWSWAGPPATPALEKVHTPGLPGIEEVAAFLQTTPDRLLKTIVFRVRGRAEGQLPVEANGQPAWVLAVVRGDHDVNEGKVRSASGWRVELASEHDARAAGFAVGYVSPRAIRQRRDTIMLVDPDAAQGEIAWIVGADEPDCHARGFVWQRDVGDWLGDPSRVRVVDIRNARAGDPSPRAPGARLVESRGIEVGHIFKLGTKYSDAMGFWVLDDRQQKRPVVMGCYGIGISRTMAACVEVSHDEHGIIWPPSVAPYHVLVTVLKPGDEPHMRHARHLADRLAAAGLEVLIDDRQERPGVKFKDADLIGIPVRLTVGDQALARNGAELRLRRAPGPGETIAIDDAVSRCREALQV